ncbi:MAG: sialidase family protein [Mycobacteriales bacterium]
MRRTVIAVAALGVLSISPGLVMAQQPAGPATFEQATFAEQDAGIQRLTDAVQLTKDELSPSRGFTAPTSMLPDPDNPRNIVAATADLRTKICHLVRSVDAGLTWQILAASPSPEDYPFCTSTIAGVAPASIAWGSDGALYYGMLAYGPGEGGRSGHSSLIVAKSTDLGDSWSTTLVENNRGTPEPAADASGVTALTVDTSGSSDVVYVGYSRRFREAPKDSPLNNTPVVVATSTDAGATFGDPVNLNDFSEVTQTIAGQSYPLIMTSSFGRPFLTVHDGVVLAISDARTPFDNKPPGDSYKAMPMLVARSTDQGKTWTMSPLGPPVFTGAGAQTGMGWTPEGGPDGTFLAAYAATPESAESSGIADLVLQRSTDDGQTWSEPVAIDDDRPADNSTSFYPQLGVAPNGRVDVVWQDNRGLSDSRFNVRYTYSTDGGVTWADNVQVNDQPINFNLGISFNSDVRQPPGVASTDEYAAIGWADPRLGDDLTRTQDAFGAVAQFAPLPSTASRLPLLAAAFGGLVAAGIVLLLIKARGGRRGGTPSDAQRRESVSTR